MVGDNTLFYCMLTFTVLGSSSPETSSLSDSTAALSNFARGLLSEIAIRPSVGTGLICQNSAEL